jgi:hypothetical protein
LHDFHTNLSWIVPSKRIPGVVSRHHYLPLYPYFREVAALF